MGTARSEITVYPKLNVWALQRKLFRTCQDVTYDLKCVEFEYEILRHWCNVLISTHVSHCSRKFPQRL